MGITYPQLLFWVIDRVIPGSKAFIFIIQQENAISIRIMDCEIFHATRLV
jgi:hypothetical protein